MRGLVVIPDSRRLSGDNQQGHTHKTVRSGRIGAFKSVYIPAVGWVGARDGSGTRGATKNFRIGGANGDLELAILDGGLVAWLPPGNKPTALGARKRHRTRPGRIIRDGDVKLEIRLLKKHHTFVRVLPVDRA